MIPTFQLGQMGRRSRATAVAGGSWATTANITHTANVTNWAGFTMRQIIPESGLAAGSRVRLTLSGPSTGSSLVIASAYFGRQSVSGGTHAYDTTPVQILFSGSAGATVPVGGTVLTDDIVISVGAGQRCVLGVNCTLGDMPDSGVLTGWFAYEKAGADAATVSASGYTQTGIINRALLIKMIEVFSP